MQDTRAFDEIVLRIEIDDQRNACGASSRNQHRLRKFQLALGGHLAFLADEIRVHIRNAAKPQRRIQKAGAGQIQSSDCQLHVLRGERGVGGIHWADFAVDLHGAAAGQFHGKEHREIILHRNVA